MEVARNYLKWIVSKRLLSNWMVLRQRMLAGNSVLTLEVQSTNQVPCFTSDTDIPRQIRIQSSEHRSWLGDPLTAPS
jgi:hypothetical protein